MQVSGRLLSWYNIDFLQYAFSDTLSVWNPGHTSDTQTVVGHNGWSYACLCSRHIGSVFHKFHSYTAAPRV